MDFIPDMKILYAENINDYSLWLKLWEKNPYSSVFYHPEYINLYSDKYAHACAAFYENTDGSVLYPFLLRNLKSESFWKPEAGESVDIISPYGYGGPLTFLSDNNKATGKTEERLLKDFYKAFYN